MTYRPGGVIALAIIFILLAVLAIIGAIAIWTIAIPNEYQTISWWIINNIYWMSLGYPPLIIVGFSVPLESMLQYISIYNTLGVGALIFAGIYILTGVGLLTMKKWGYYLALIIGILMIIGGIFGLLAIVGLIPLIFGIVVVIYLAGDVKYEFE